MNIVRAAEREREVFGSEPDLPIRVGGGMARAGYCRVAGGLLNVDLPLGDFWGGRLEGVLGREIGGVFSGSMMWWVERDVVAREIAR